MKYRQVNGMRQGGPSHVRIDPSPPTVSKSAQHKKFRQKHLPCMRADGEGNWYSKAAVWSDNSTRRTTVPVEPVGAKQ